MGFHPMSMRTEWLASSQTCRSVDFDAWCKHALTHALPVAVDSVLRMRVFLCRQQGIYQLHLQNNNKCEILQKINLLKQV